MYSQSWFLEDMYFKAFFPCGTLLSRGAEIDFLKRHMERDGLYALALSETRSRGSGSLDVGNGFAWIFQELVAVDLLVELDRSSLLARSHQVFVDCTGT